MDQNNLCNINVIGGSGFIGTCLVKMLINNNQFKVRIIDKNKSKNFPDLCHIGDVRSLKDMSEIIQNNSVIFNLAAEHKDDVLPVSLYDDVNVRGAINVCDSARINHVKTIVFTSSVAVYGFAPVGTNESGAIAPFNDYGRSKWEAENIYKDWQSEDPDVRTLIIVRPTVVFGEGNRGNVFNLFKFISSGHFVMIGNGLNKKSIAYVENIASFLVHTLRFKPGLHIYNYTDKPDFTMNSLVEIVNKALNKKPCWNIRIPFLLGLIIGGFFDFIGKIFGKKFSISFVRIKKFCSNSVYTSKIEGTGFSPPIPLDIAIDRTIRYEFIKK